MAGKTLFSFAAAAVLMLAACGDDDDSGGLGSLGEPEIEQPGETPPGEAPEAPADPGDGAAGGEQTFCDTFNALMAQSPSPDDWDMDVLTAATPPAEIADAWQAVIDGEPGLSHQSEVTRWVTDNCF